MTLGRRGCQHPELVRLSLFPVQGPLHFVCPLPLRSQALGSSCALFVRIGRTALQRRLVGR